MKMRKQKKGFTITELVIVIAVIAVLAAVLIPTFVSLVRRANESKDIQLVHNLNTALTIDGKEHETMQSALDAALESGYDVDKINASATDNEILWDSKNDVFCYLKKGQDKPEYIPETELEGGVKPADVAYWQICDSMPNVEDQKYSVYAGTNWADQTVTTTVGFDAGEKTNITSVTYDRKDATEAQNVIIRTNGGTFTVNAPVDTVKHYGYVDNLNVTAVAVNDCYHEYGFINTFSSFGSGKFIVHSGAKFHQTEEEVKAVLSGKNYDLADALFAQHFFLNGKCIGCDMLDHEHVKGEIISNVSATCKKEGSLVYKCSVCGNAIPETLPMLDHEWSDWTTDNSNHSRTCSGCGETESGVHTWESNTCTVCSMAYVNATSITIEPKDSIDAVKWHPGDSLEFSAKVEPASAMGTVEWKMEIPALNSGYKYFEVDNEGKVTCLNSTSTEKYLILTAKITNLDGSIVTGTYTLPATTNFKQEGITIHTTDYVDTGNSYPTYKVGDDIVFDLSPIMNFSGTFQFISIEPTPNKGFGGVEFAPWIFDSENKTLKTKAMSTCTVDANSASLTLKFSRNGVEISLDITSYPKVIEKFYFDNVEFVPSGVVKYTSSKPMTVGDTCQVTVPEFAARYGGKTIVWSTYNEKVVTIDQQGNITAVGAGKCAIRGDITLDNGEVYTIKKQIWVKEKA